MLKGHDLSLDKVHIHHLRSTQRVPSGVLWTQIGYMVSGLLRTSRSNDSHATTIICFAVACSQYWKCAMGVGTHPKAQPGPGSS